MKSKLRLLGSIATAALLLGSGVALGWYLRGQRHSVPPVSTDFTLDAQNRPASLKTFITLPNGRRVQHGQQFNWEWQDRPAGCIVTGLTVRREDYDAGDARGFATWNDPSPVLAPQTPIPAAILTKYPDER